MKTLIALLFLSTAFCAPITKAEEITYDFLLETGKQTGYCDHIPVFKKIFETIKVKAFLEFGVGYSTKYFLDSCTKVISVEFISPGWSADWLKKCLDLYRNYSNWVPVAYFSGYKGDFAWAPYKYFGSEGLFKADCYFSSTRQSYASIDNTYQTEFQTFVTNLAKYNKIDIALVDPGICLRGEIVQLLFGKINIILSHDTRASQSKMNPYGFNRLIVPDDYEEIHFSTGVGTTAWVRKTDALLPLIQVLKDHAK